jgi:hypothetical protein
MERSPIANMKRDMTSRTIEVKKNNSPSPVSYPLKDNNWRNLAS